MEAQGKENQRRYLSDYELALILLEVIYYHGEKMDEKLHRKILLAIKELNKNVK